MKRSIPVNVGLHSGIGIPQAMLEFTSEDAEKMFTDSVVDGVEYSLSYSLQYTLSKSNAHRLLEVRLIPKEVVYVSEDQ